MNRVRQPRTIGDSERDQPLDGHGPPPGAGTENEGEREREREREGGRDERREGGGVPASSTICQELQNLQSHHGERISLAFCDLHAREVNLNYPDLEASIIK